MTGRIARIVNRMTPEEIIVGTATIADGVYDFGESIRTGDSVRDAAFGVAGNTLGSIAGFNAGAGYLERFPIRSKFSVAVPVATAFVGNLIGGYLGDRVNDVFK